MRAEEEQLQLNSRSISDSQLLQGDGRRTVDNELCQIKIRYHIHIAEPSLLLRPICQRNDSPSGFPLAS